MRVKYGLTPGEPSPYSLSPRAASSTAEQLTLNQQVEGSNPSRPTNVKPGRDNPTGFCFASLLEKRASGPI